MAMLALVTMAAQMVHGVMPSGDELAASQRWAAAKFVAAEAPTRLIPGLDVVFNHDPVLKNHRMGNPFHLGGQTYTRGLFCHAPSKVTVRLPGRGKAFTAVAGVDAKAGGGSVVLSIGVEGNAIFTSDVIHGGEAGVAIQADLSGATAFTLEATDAGDGISCDQVDWAEAKVVLEDGSEVWLDDLPLAQSPVLLDPGQLPFSFTYAGKLSAELLPTWACERQAEGLDADRIAHTVTYSAPDSGLVLRCEAIEFRDFPTVEWTLYFKNTGEADTPIIENIQALDMRMERSDIGEYTLHHFVGSKCSAEDYGPRVSTLAPGSTKRIAPAGGRGSNGEWPYFNIESTAGDGAIIAIGWPGQWAASFERDDKKVLHITAGQELTHFKLLPGEEVRSPLMVVQFYNGSWTRAQNVWRRWMMAHSMPKPGGQLPPPMTLAASSRAYEEMIKADTEKQIMFIDRYLEEDIKLDYWWMDAGWYIQEKGWPQVGTWEIDPKRFPDGFKPISAHAHAKGMKLLVWFEPERVAPDTWLTKNHPEWILGGADGGLLDLGNPDAWNWLVNHVDTLLTEQGIDLYRQDFNMDPLGFWRGKDAEDRQGITEIKHVSGYLAYWDELIRRHPNMLIDSCASGGRRNDLETMRRAASLWRSDYAFEPVGHQGMTYGISFWLPFHGTGTVGCVDAPYYGTGVTPVQPYAFWSNAAPSLVSGVDMRERAIDYPALKALFDQWRGISPCYYGDYYPLTPYSLDRAAWIGWQFNLPEQGKGMVQVFRRDESIYEAARLPLQGLEAEKRYRVAPVDRPDAGEVLTGAELMEKGLRVSIEERPGVVVYAYSAAN